MAVSLSHHENAPSPIESSVAGMVTLVRLLFSAKACAPILFILAGNEILENEQPSKQWSLMSVTPAGMLMSLTQVLFSKPPSTFTLGFSVTLAPDLWQEINVS